MTSFRRNPSVSDRVRFKHGYLHHRNVQHDSRWFYGTVVIITKKRNRFVYKIRLWNSKGLVLQHAEDWIDIVEKLSEDEFITALLLDR